MQKITYVILDGKVSKVYFEMEITQSSLVVLTQRYD